MPAIAVAPKTHHAVARWAPPAIAALVALGVVLLVHGFVPGLLNTDVWDYLLEGDMRCLSNMGTRALSSWCDAYGNPLGYPFLTGGPIVYMGWAIMETSGLSSESAYLISGALLDAIALAGAYGLLRILGVRWTVALVASVVYLISPTILGLRDFGGTFNGMTLLPALALADLLMMRAFDRGERRTMALATVAYTVAKTVVLFLDGYAFAMSVLVTSALWLWWLIAADVPLRKRIIATAAMFLSHAVAVSAYRWYAPPIAGPDPVGVFRSMGLDVVTLLLPTKYVWSADIVGETWDHSTLWGDGTNSAYNFVGLVSIGLSVTGIALRARQPYVLSFAAAGLVALVLSFGPSLKVNDVRGPLSSRPTTESYFMPASDATLELPWDRVYKVPGLAQMRATYRWSAVTRLAVIVLAALALDWLLQQPRRRTIAVIVAVLALVEVIPNVPLLLSQYRDHSRSRAAFGAAVMGDLRSATRPTDTVFVMSPDDTYIDYLVNYLTSTVKVKALNAGGDKNFEFAQTGWPRPIAELARPGAGRDQAVNALKSGVITALIVPYFHLRWAAYGWPPTESSRLSAVRHFAPILHDPEFAVRRYRWFATVRLAR